MKSLLVSAIAALACTSVNAIAPAPGALTASISVNSINKMLKMLLPEVTH